MKKLLVVLLSSLLAIALFGCSESKDENVLVMATEPTFEPYEFKDGDKTIGIDVEIAEAICAKLGKTLEVVDIDFKSIIPSIQSGKYDFGMAGITVSEERMEQVNFSDSYATGVQVVVVKEDSSITSVDDLFEDGAYYLVGTQTGTTGFIYASDDIEAAGLGEVQSFEKTTDAASALVNDQIDCIILDNEPAKAIVAKNAGLKILETEYSVEEYAIAINKENTELQSAINNALNELKADGTVDAIINKYIVK